LKRTARQLELCYSSSSSSSLIYGLHSTSSIPQHAATDRHLHSLLSPRFACFCKLLSYIICHAISALLHRAALTVCHAPLPHPAGKKLPIKRAIKYTNVIIAG
jgi:hypothetical protein